MSSDQMMRYWLGLNQVRGIGPVRMRMLLQAFGDAEQAWKAPESALRELRLDKRTLANFLRVRSRIDLDSLLRAVDRAGVQVLTWDNLAYPDLLSQIKDPPPLIFVKGDIQAVDTWGIAMVGSRKATSYGREVARQLASELAIQGVTLVSGMARGIDAIVHRAALAVGGRTLAVLGSGVDVIYPPEHRKLAEEIIANGAIISDYPLGTRPEGQNFPPRNRIISGLSLGTVVVEASHRSGALITAEFALDQGRDVFSVPGSILNQTSAGCNRLLRDGAHVVTAASDIMEVLHLDTVAEKQAARRVLPDNPTEAKVFDALSREPQHVDKISRELDMSVAVVNSTLVIMELKGMVYQVTDMQYVRAFEPEEEYKTNAESTP